jgi:hypothetical protein
MVEARYLRDVGIKIFGAGAENLELKARDTKAILIL